MKLNSKVEFAINEVKWAEERLEKIKEENEPQKRLAILELLEAEERLNELLSYQ